jgi:hypothetical protein
MPRPPSQEPRVEVWIVHGSVHDADWRVRAEQRHEVLGQQLPGAEVCRQKEDAVALIDVGQQLCELQRRRKQERCKLGIAPSGL